MITWGYAYKAARKGPWEEAARDRNRFKIRVSRYEDLLKEVLNDKHRSKIYNARFSNRYFYIL